ncbi:sterol desaturase family protein [Methylophaga sp.]|uniref:sterol desaturase family protein n=1 Tax=Methylophaga sp. TaxID=2024840 RepID=UPI003A9116E7
MSFADVVSLFEESVWMEYVAYFFLFNLAIVLLELGLDFATRKQRCWKDTGANLTIFGFNQLLDKTFVGWLGLVALMPFQWLAPVAIPMNAWTWVLAIIFADLTYYWMHRTEHEHRVLWANHSVHHSSKDYNLTVSMRLSIVEPLIEWIFLIPMILMGFNTFQAIVALILVAQYQTWIHTERVGKLRWLDWWFNTPSVHRVHHGSNPQYLDKNYGGILMIWDHLFGTYQKEHEKVNYGLNRDIKTNNPIKINFIEYWLLWQDIKQCRSIRDVWRIVFGDLSWRPDYFK